jgi:hypothetical protein
VSAPPAPRATPRPAPPAEPAPRPGPAAPPPAVRTFLAGYARTLLVPLVGLAAVLAGGVLVPAPGWPVAAAAVAAWTAVVAASLRRRGWRPAAVHAVTWAAPAAALAPLTGPGWLTPGGLVLWWAVSTLFAAALAMAARPCATAVPQRARPLRAALAIPPARGRRPLPQGRRTGPAGPTAAGRPRTERNRTP